MEEMFLGQYERPGEEANMIKVRTSIIDMLSTFMIATITTGTLVSLV